MRATPFALSLIIAAVPLAACTTESASSVETTQVSPPAPPPSHDYTHPWYGFVLPVPDWLGEPKDSGDGTGVIWSARDVTLVARGGQLPKGGKLTPESVNEQWESAGGEVTYRSTEDEQNFSISGYTDNSRDTIFYERYQVEGRNFRQTQWRYPTAMKVEMDAPVTATVVNYSTGPMGKGLPTK